MRGIHGIIMALMLLVTLCAFAATPTFAQEKTDVVEYTGEEQEEEDVLTDENMKDIAKGVFYIILAVVLYFIFQMPLFLALTITGLISLINVFFDVWFQFI